MPNGGSIDRMFLRPEQGGGHIIYCSDGELTVHTRDGDVVLKLNEQETLILERFLRFSLHDRGKGVVHGKGCLYDDIQGVPFPPDPDEPISDADRLARWQHIGKLMDWAAESWERHGKSDESAG